MSRQIVMVTGGAGFIGSNITADLLARGYEVSVCDDPGGDPWKWRNLSRLGIRDLVRPEHFFRWLDAHAGLLEAIVHMGAISSTVEKDTALLTRVNFGLSRDIFRWAAQHKSRFLYASSAATYGDGSAGFHDREDRAYLGRLRPLTAYGRTKAVFDRFAARQAERYLRPPQWVGLKFFNVYGPNEEHKGAQRSMVSQMWAQTRAGGPVRLFRSLNPNYCDGCQLRDFVHVRDVCSVVGWLMGKPEVNGIYNFGTGVAVSFNDLAKALFAAIGRQPAISYFDPPGALASSYQYCTTAEMAKLRSAGYCIPATPVAAGVADYVQNYLSTLQPVDG